MAQHKVITTFHEAFSFSVSNSSISGDHLIWLCIGGCFTHWYARPPLREGYNYRLPIATCCLGNRLILLLPLHAASTDYETRVQVVTFDPTDIEQDVSIPILSDGIVESAEEFFGQLSIVEGERRRVRVGQINSTTITILDSDGGSVAIVNVVRMEAEGRQGLGFVAIQ